MVNDIEHLFVYLLAICISSLEKYLLRSSAHFKINLFFANQLYEFFIYIYIFFFFFSVRSHRWQPTRLLSLGFSRQRYWSGLPFPSPMHESEKWKWSCSVVSDSSRPHGLQRTRLLCTWDFPGKSTGVGCHCLLCCLCYYHTILITITLITITVVWNQGAWCLYLYSFSQDCIDYLGYGVVPYTL